MLTVTELFAGPTKDYFHFTDTFLYISYDNDGHVKT